MALFLGIDTGGTYTDAVLFDDVHGVVASAKALTTKYDLIIGIREAVERVLMDAHPIPAIRLVSLSTTLATNAVVEGQGAPICLLLIGYPSDALEYEGLGRVMKNDPVVFIAGGHTVTGEEQAPLDLVAARQAIEKHAAHVAAFAVSGYFAVRNPGHELIVRQLIREMTDLPVTCGHELSSNLNAPRRALTAALNARLIPFLRDLIVAVRALLSEKRIAAPLMVVKGDGSLVEAQVALERPVETILSGPAASVVGARHLSGERDMVVVDMGGTTTDIALVRDGRPMLSRDGAVVGGWRTMVEAITIHTFGLGGDSEVQPSNTEWEGLTIGPRRLVPLSLLAHQYPAVLEVLHRQCSKRTPSAYDGQFVLRQRPLDGAGDMLSPLEQRIWEATACGPVALEQLVADSRGSYLVRQAVNRLIEQGWLVASGFTPTDAAHILGYQRDWSREAARLGAVLWLRAHRGSPTVQDDDVEALCTGVLRQLTLQAGRAVVSVVAAEEYGVNLETCLPARRLFVDQALIARNGHDRSLDVSLMLNHTLVAIGAPVSTYYPPVAERLHTRLCIPPHAAIANAVGAVVGGITQMVRVQIRPLDDETLRVHLPDGIRDFGTLEEAAACATEAAVSLAEKRAYAAGAAHVYIQTQRHDEIVNVRGLEVYLGSEVVAIATGRPRLGER